MKIHGDKVVSIESLATGRWAPVKISHLKNLKPGTMCAFKLERHADGQESTLYDVYRPPRRRNESPVQYYRRTKTVDNNYTRGHRGWYYCNPAHCSNRWRKKAERDEHLQRAYAALA